MIMKEKKKNTIFIVLCVVSFFVSFIVGALVCVQITGSLPQRLVKVKWDDSVGKQYKNLDYVNDGGHKFDLYIPTKVSTDANLILYIHGGSFNSGSKEDGDLWCKYFTSKGYVTATLDYTLQKKGVNCEGKKDCFGFWIGENEGTHRWLGIFDELKSRGVEKLGFVCIDGLSGLEEAITNTFPTAVVCRCMVHLVRNSTKYIPTKHRKEFCSDLRAIYGAVSIGEAENALAVLNEKWGKQYPSAVRVWNDNFVYVQRLFEYPAEIRKMIYTTNAIESFNSALRKVTDRKAAFPNEMAVMKILYLRTLDVVKKWTMPYPNWSLIRGKLDFLWGVGWDF